MDDQKPAQVDPVTSLGPNGDSAELGLPRIETEQVAPACTPASVENLVERVIKLHQDTVGGKRGQNTDEGPSDGSSFWNDLVRQLDSRHTGGGSPGGDANPHQDSERRGKFSRPKSNCSYELRSAAAKTEQQQQKESSEAREPPASRASSTGSVSRRQSQEKRRNSEENPEKKEERRKLDDLGPGPSVATDSQVDIPAPRASTPFSSDHGQSKSDFAGGTEMDLVFFFSFTGARELPEKEKSAPTGFPPITEASRESMTPVIPIAQETAAPESLTDDNSRDGDRSHRDEGSTNQEGPGSHGEEKEESVNLNSLDGDQRPGNQGSTGPSHANGATHTDRRSPGRNRVEMLREHIAHLETELHHVHERWVQADERRGIAERELGLKDEELSDTTATMLRLCEDKRELLRENASLKSEVGSEQHANAKLRNQLDASDREIDQVNTQISNAVTKFTAQKAEISQQQQFIDVLQTWTKTLETEVGRRNLSYLHEVQQVILELEYQPSGTDWQSAMQDLRCAFGRMKTALLTAVEDGWTNLTELRVGQEESKGQLRIIDQLQNQVRDLQQELTEWRNSRSGGTYTTVVPPVTAIPPTNPQRSFTAPPVTTSVLRMPIPSNPVSTSFPVPVQMNPIATTFAPQFPAFNVTTQYAAATPMSSWGFSDPPAQTRAPIMSIGGGTMPVVTTTAAVPFSFNPVATTYVPPAAPSFSDQQYMARTMPPPQNDLRSDPILVAKAKRPKAFTNLAKLDLEKKDLT